MLLFFGSPEFLHFFDSITLVSFGSNLCPPVSGLVLLTELHFYFQMAYVTEASQCFLSCPTIMVVQEQICTLTWPKQREFCRFCRSSRKRGFVVFSLKLAGCDWTSSSCQRVGLMQEGGCDDKEMQSSIGSWSQSYRLNPCQVVPPTFTVKYASRVFGISQLEQNLFQLIATESRFFMIINKI